MKKLIMATGLLMIIISALLTVYAGPGQKVDRVDIHGKQYLQFQVEATGSSATYKYRTKGWHLKATFGSGSDSKDFEGFYKDSQLEERETSSTVELPLKNILQKIGVTDEYLRQGGTLYLDAGQIIVVNGVETDPIYDSEDGIVNGIVDRYGVEWSSTAKSDLKSYYKLSIGFKPVAKGLKVTEVHWNKTTDTKVIDNRTHMVENSITLNSLSGENCIETALSNTGVGGSDLYSIEQENGSASRTINASNYEGQDELYVYFYYKEAPPEGNVEAKLKLSVNPNEITKGTTEDVLVTLDASGSTSPTGVDKYIFEVGKTYDMRNAVKYETSSDKWSTTFLNVESNETIYGRVTAYDEELNEDDDARDQVTIGEAELLNGAVRYNMWENAGSEGNFVKGTKLGSGKLEMTDWEQGNEKFFEYPREIPRTRNSNSEYDYRKSTSKWDQLEKYYTNEEYFLLGDHNNDMNEKITSKDFGDVIDIYYTKKDSNVNLIVRTILKDKGGNTVLTRYETTKLEISDQYYYLDIEDIYRKISIYRSTFTHSSRITNEFQKEINYPGYDDFSRRRGYVIYDGDKYIHMSNQYSVSTRIVEEDTYDHDPDTYEIFFAPANTDITVTIFFQESEIGSRSLEVGVGGADEDGQPIFTKDDGAKFYIPVNKYKADITLSDIYFGANKDKFDRRRIELENRYGHLLHGNTYWRREPNGWTNNYTGQEAVQLYEGKYEVTLEAIDDYERYRNGDEEELYTDKIEFEVVDAPADATAEITIADLYKELAEDRDGKITTLTETFKTGKYRAASDIFGRSNFYNSNYEDELGTYMGFSDEYINSKGDLDDLTSGRDPEKGRLRFPTYRIEKYDYLKGETEQSRYIYYFAYRVKYHYINDSTGEVIKTDEVKILPSEYSAKIDEDYAIMDDIITSEFKKDDIEYLGYSREADKKRFREYPRYDELTIKLNIEDGEYNEDIYLFFNGVDDVELPHPPDPDKTGKIFFMYADINDYNNTDIGGEIVTYNKVPYGDEKSASIEVNKDGASGKKYEVKSVKVYDLDELLKSSPTPFKTHTFTSGEKSDGTVSYTEALEEPHEEIVVIFCFDEKDSGTPIEPEIPPDTGGNGNIIFNPSTSFQVSGNREGWVKQNISVQVSIAGDKTAERSSTASRSYAYEEEYEEETGTDEDGNPIYETRTRTVNSTASCSFTETWKVGTISVTGSASGTVNGLSGGNVTITTQGDNLNLSATLNEWVSNQKVWGSDSAPNGGSWTEHGTPSANTTPPGLYSGTSGIYKLDKTNPNSSSSIPSRDWTNIPYSVNITATDNLSGFWNSESYYNVSDRSYYNRNRGNQYLTKGRTSETKTININQNGVYSINVILKDIAKNIMTQRTYGEYKFDNINPYIAQFDIIGCSDVVQRNIPGVGNGYQYMADYDNKIRVTIGDELSGLIDTKFSITKTSSFPSLSSMKNLNESTGEAIAGSITKTFYINLNAGSTKESIAATEFNELKEGLWYVHIYQRDRAGNVTQTTSPPLFINKIRPH